MRHKLRISNLLLLSAFLLFLIALWMQLSAAAKGEFVPGIFQDAMLLILISAVGLGVNLYAYGAGRAWRALRYVLPALFAAAAAFVTFLVWPSRNMFETAFSVFLLLASATAVGAMAAYAIRYKGSGRPLLVVRRSLTGWAEILVGSILLVWSVSIFRNALVSGDADLYGIASGIFRTVLIAYFVFSGWVRVRILEDGISHQAGFIPWDIIEDYGWDEDRPQILTVALTQRRWLSKEVHFSIPKSQQDEVEDIFSRKVIQQGRKIENPPA
jgi:hypothetical protein